MSKVYMIVEHVGPSIYEEHTIPFVYARREWAEYQLKILERQNDEEGSMVRLSIRETELVTRGPK